MKLLGSHIGLFKRKVSKEAMDLLTLNIQLCINENMEVRDGANEMLGKLMQQISEGLTPDRLQDRETF